MYTVYIMIHVLLGKGSIVSVYHTFQDSDYKVSGKWGMSYFFENWAHTHVW